MQNRETLFLKGWKFLRNDVFLFIALIFNPLNRLNLPLEICDGRL